MLTTIWILAVLSVLGLIFGAEAPTGTETATVEDEDEKELIASVGDGVAPPIAKQEEDDEPETPAEGDEPEVVETAAADDKPTATTVTDATGSAPVGGGSGGERPVSGAVEPVAAATQPAVAAYLPSPESFKDDPIIKRLDGAIEKIEESNLIEDWEKDQKIAAILEQREARATKLAEVASSQENQYRDTKARELGITRAQLDQAWKESLIETHKTLGRASHDASMLLLTQKAAAVKKAIPKNGATAAPPKPIAPKATAPTPITPKGARVAPPAAVIPAPPKPRSDEEELVDSVRREVKSGVRV